MRKIFHSSKIFMDSSFLQGGWHFILLNSVIPGHSAGTLLPSELHFLQIALTRYATLPTLIALHHHVKPVHGDIDKVMLTNADMFSHIIASHKNVRVVLCGHVHQAFAQTVNEVCYLASPSTYFQFNNDVIKFTKDQKPTPGYRWLELDDDGTIETTVVSF